MKTEEALRWIERLFECTSGSISPETPRADIAAWDSLGLLTLMAQLNDDFGIELSDSELQSLQSVNDILVLLRSRGKVD